MDIRIDYLPTSSLKPYSNNARKHGKKDIAAIVQSITNTSHTQEGVNHSIFNGFGMKNNIMRPTTAPRRLLKASSDNSAGC